MPKVLLYPRLENIKIRSETQKPATLGDFNFIEILPVPLLPKIPSSQINIF
jgi:hypothetical protein